MLGRYGDNAVNEVGDLSSSKRVLYWLIVAGCGWVVWLVGHGAWLQATGAEGLNSVYIFVLLPWGTLVLLLGLATLKVLLFGRSRRNRHRHAA
ncbi:hypothetical protein ACVWZN_001625 [Lysobacter sp. HA35]